MVLLSTFLLNFTEAYIYIEEISESLLKSHYIMGCRWQKESVAVKMIQRIYSLILPTLLQMFFMSVGNLTSHSDKPDTWLHCQRQH